MKLSIDQDLCIECGLCEESLPQYFGRSEGKVVIIDPDVAIGDQETARETRADCPGEAIGLGE